MADPADTLYYTAWLFCHDQEFRELHQNVNPRVFPKGAIQYLVALAHSVGQNLSRSFVTTKVEGDREGLRKYGAEAPLVVTVYDLLVGFHVDGDERPATRETCGRWLEARSLKVGVDLAAKMLAKGDYNGARAALGEAQYTLEEDDGDAKPLNGIEDADFIIAGARWRWQDATPTGLHDLDQAWAGGARPGDIGIVMGGTGMGKSMWLAMLAAEAFWGNRSVVYYTTELTKDQVATRILLGLLRQGIQDLPRDKPMAEQIAAAAKAHGREVGSKSRFEVRWAEGSLLDIIKDLEAYQAEHGAYPDVLIIDSPIDLLAFGKVEKGWEGIQQTFIRLRRMARKLRLVVWTSAQVKGEFLEKGYSSLRHMADAFAMAKKAHYVLGLVQTEEQRTHIEGEHLMTAYVLKDSLHGTTDAKIVVKPRWGDGANGFPGVDWKETYGLHLSVKKDND